MLIRKMLRDVAKQKSSFLAIFLLMLIGCYIFSGITTEYHGMQVTLDTFQTESNMADATIQSASFPDIEDSDLQTQPVMVLPAIWNDYEDTNLDVNVIQQDIISKMKVMEGTGFSNQDGVWLDERFAKEHNLHVNDSFSFTIQGQHIEKRILGLIQSVAYIYQVKDNAMMADHKHTGFLYLNASFCPFPFTPNQQLITSTLSEHELKTRLVQLMGNTNYYLTLKKDNPNISMLQDEINQHKELGMIFSMTFLAIAVLVSITTIHRLLNNQRLQIGILKALGFSKGKLFVHYASHCGCISLIGSILGCLLGAWTFPALTYPFMNKIYSLPSLTGVPIPFTWLLPIITSLLCILISLILCRKHLHIPTAAILSGNVKQKIRTIKLPKLFHHTSFITQWNLKDVTRNRLRSFMSIFGVFGCTALLISAFGIYTTMIHLSAWTFQKLETYDCKITGTFDEALAKRLTTAMDADAIMNQYINIQTSDDQDQILLTVLSDTRYVHLAKDEHTFLTLTNGIAVSKNIADQYHLKIGDTLKWKPMGTNTWQTTPIEAIIRTPMNQGITMMKTQYEQIGLTFQPTSLAGNTIQEDQLKDPAITSIQYHEDMIHNLDTMMDGTIMMLSVFLTAAILLGSVILYNLGSLSYMERYYELSTLKVLGFQSSALQKIMIQQNLWLTLLGILFGIPGGYLLLEIMLDTIQSNMDIMIYLPITVILLSCGGTLLLSFFIILIVSRKVKQIDMVSALKSND